MKIYDCFLFNDENELLKIRLEELNYFVDFFIIVECKYNHQGKPKGKKISSSILKKFSSKIRYYFIETKPNNNNSWVLENWQRNIINSKLSNCNNDDVIMISDLDEIPNLSGICFANINKSVLAFKQLHTMYKLNLLREYGWIGTKLCKYSTLKSAQWLRSLKVHKKYPFWRFDKQFFSEQYYNNFQIIDNGGWHFGWLRNAKDIIIKINSYAHTEHNIKKNNDENFINECIRKKVSFLNTNEHLKVIDIKKLPKFIINNINKYKNWIV